MRRTSVAMLILMVVLTILTGCFKAGAKKDAALGTAIEGVKPAVLYADEVFGMYEAALDAIAAYIEEPTAEKRAAALSACREGVSVLTGTAIPDIPLTGDELERVRDAGVNADDYGGLYGMLGFYADDFAYQLRVYGVFLTESPVSDNILAFELGIARRGNDLVKQYILYVVNGMFAASAGDALELFANEWLPARTSLYTDAFVWQTNRAAQETASLLDAYEDMLGEYEAFFKNADNSPTFTGTGLPDAAREWGLSYEEALELTAGLTFDIDVAAYLKELYGR